MVSRVALYFLIAATSYTLSFSLPVPSTSAFISPVFTGTPTISAVAKCQRRCQPLFSSPPEKISGAVAQTLSNLPLRTSLGLVVGSASLLATVVHALSPASSDVLQTSQSRENLLALFSSVYLLTVCVSEIDFSAINRERILREKEVRMSTILKLQPEGLAAVETRGGVVFPSDFLLGRGEGPRIRWTHKGSSIVVNAGHLDVLCDLLGPNLSLSLIGWDARAKRWAVLACGTQRTVPSVSRMISPVMYLPNAKNDGILREFADGEVESNLYLPVFNNVPGGVELEEGGVAEGAQCVLVQPILVQDLEDDERLEFGVAEGCGADRQDFELDSFCMVVGVGRAKGLTVGDIAWTKNLCMNGIIKKRRI